MVEIAILMPVVLLMILGAVDYGRISYQEVALDNAAYAGAQFGAQSIAASRDVSGIETAVLDDVAGSIDPASVDCKVEGFCVCPGGGSIDCKKSRCSSGDVPYAYVSVRVHKTFTTLVNYPGIPNKIELYRQAQIRAR